ncbi:hypothetical protein VIBNIAM115_1190004 [Vibrio nigripulchritudo AM115]|nr:hypothetical protein VIBNIAM115_1190004 [Vibrio nigripulchritudo AM115]
MWLGSDDPAYYSVTQPLGVEHRKRVYVHVEKRPFPCAILLERTK